VNDKQRRGSERVQRVIMYMDTPNEDFPEGSKGDTLTARLRELSAQATALDAEREAKATKRRQGTEGREETRTALRRMRKSAWDTYKAIAPEHPEIRGLFESPSKSNNDQALATSVRSYANAAAPHSALFNEYGLTPAFFNDMRLKADALDGYAALQGAGITEGVNANAALDETLRQADEVVERLDAIVRNKYRDNPARLSEWESASRLERAPRRKPEDDDEPPQPPPANG